jgi:hypothetical protein
VKQIHDERQGSAIGQPEIKVADSIPVSQFTLVDESTFADANSVCNDSQLKPDC